MSISLVIADTDSYVLAHEAVKVCMSSIKFDDVLIFSDRDDCWGGLPAKKIPKFTKKGEYDNLFVKELPKQVTTDYCLIIQFDGFIINPQEWNNLFLHYDYIGAPWPSHNHGPMNVGNGGFCLRSKKLLKMVSEYEYNFFDKEVPEDLHICQNLRPELEKRGLHFPHESIASHFSAESYIYRYPTFGFHNIRFLPLVYKDKLDFLLDNLTDRVLNSFGDLLLQNMKFSPKHFELLKKKIERVKNGHTEDIR